MTFLMKYLRIYNIGIHINLINESVRKNFLKFSYRRKDGVFFVRCRRTYVLKNNILYIISIQKFRIVKYIEEENYSPSNHCNLFTSFVDLYFYAYI